MSSPRNVRPNNTSNNRGNNSSKLPKVSVLGYCLIPGAQIKLDSFLAAGDYELKAMLLVKEYVKITNYTCISGMWLPKVLYAIMHPDIRGYIWLEELELKLLK